MGSHEHDNGQALLERAAHELGKRAWRLAYCLSRNSADADEIVQDAFIVLAEKIGSVRQQAWWPWFASVIVNVARNRVRRESYRKADSIDFDRDEGGAMNIEDRGNRRPDELAEVRETKDMLKRKLFELPEDERRALTLLYVSGLSHRQACKVDGVSLGIFKSHVRRGMNRLRQQMGVPEATLSKSLALLPLPMPVTGIENASHAWISVAKASLGQLGSTSALTHATVTGAVMTGKQVALMVGVATFALGGAAGFGVSEILGDSRQEVYENVPLSSQSNNAAQENSIELKRQYDSLLAEHKALQRNMASTQDDRNAIANELDKRSSVIEALQDDVQNLKKRLEANVSESTKTDTMVEADGKAFQHLADVKAGIQNGDKKTAILGMRALIAMWPEGQKEYFEAFNMMMTAGNPAGKTTNSLNLSMPEFVSLMGVKQRDYALETPSAGLSARAFALGMLPWDFNLSSEKKTQIIADTLNNSEDPRDMLHAIKAFKQVEDSSSVTHLKEAVDNKSLDTGVRVQALNAMWVTFSDHVDWEWIKTLTNSDAKALSSEAKVALAVWSPPATGFLVDTATHESWVNGQPTVELGDVVTHIEGARVSSRQDLYSRLEGYASDSMVSIEVHRDGISLALQVRKSSFEMGAVLNGRWITKKGSE